MVGDRAKLQQQVVNLHFLLSQSVAGLANPTDGKSPLHLLLSVSLPFFVLVSLLTLAYVANRSAEEESASQRPMGISEGARVLDPSETARI